MTEDLYKNLLNLKNPLIQDRLMIEENFALAYQLLPTAILETLYMVFGGAFFGSLIGIPLGICLYLTGKGKWKEHHLIHQTLGGIVNIGRSFPFAILIVALIPFTRWIVGTSLGTTASIVPLSIAAAPFIARQIETCFLEIDKNVLEAVLIMGSRTKDILSKVLFTESLPSLISAFTTILINLVGYSAMAGLVGGGGLGSVAIQYGYQRFNGFIMFWTVVLLILLVQCIQWLGNRWRISILNKRGLIKYE